MRFHLVSVAVVLAFIAGATATQAQAAPIIKGTLIDSNQDGTYDSSIDYTTAGASLVGFDGTTRWTWNASPTLKPPWLIAQGDLTGDNITDLVFNTVTATGDMCGTSPNNVSSLIRVDGRTGQATPVLNVQPAVCWIYGYATTQWIVGTARIGPWGLIGFPMYGGRGYLQDGSTVLTPDSPDFSPWYVPGSHFPETVWVPGGLFAMSSMRAWIYRDGDHQPVSDTHWVSGTTENGGRNYGYLRSFASGGRSFAVLVGGCTVWNARRAMNTGVVPSVEASSGDAAVSSNCAIHRHVETFEIAGGQIASHHNRYWSYSYDDGPLLNRVEVPSQSGVRVVYNVFDGSRWNIHVIEDPAHPETELVIAGRYAWGVSGRYVVASPSSGYTPTWTTQLLDDGRVVRSMAGAPVLVNYPDTPTSMFYDGLPVDPTSGTRSDSGFGLFTWQGSLWMTTKSGYRSWVVIG